MKSKTCGECVFFSNSENKCCLLEGPGIRYANNAACKKFKPEPPKTKQSNGDRIRQGGDDALIDFADGIRRRMCHYCAFFQEKSCVDKTCGCWEGVKLWLNAPADCVKQNGNHDTQPDLCKADNTESEGEDE